MQANESIRVALVEDNAVNRNTFQQKIQSYPDLKLVFVATNGSECLAELKGTPFKLLPQVVFMDIEMPVMNGIDTISIAKSMYPSIQFIILTIFDDDEKIFEAIKAGASGYLLKHETHVVLREAIDNVLNFGGAPMSPAIARKTLQLLSKSTAAQEKKVQQWPEMISEREKEILQYTVNGWDAKQIAAVLFISVLTVRKHIANLYEKLQVQSKAQIINMAHRNNWIDPGKMKH
jgi:DNA-binding NarL/FixJ family response regulator